jgi:hypothetical protein
MSDSSQDEDRSESISKGALLLQHNQNLGIHEIISDIDKLDTQNDSIMDMYSPYFDSENKQSSDFPREKGTVNREQSISQVADHEITASR